MSTGKYRQHKSDMQVVPAHVRLVQREVAGFSQIAQALGLTAD